MKEHLKTGASIKYKLIYEEVKEAIETGQYMAGSFLPTELQLMEHYNVSRTTIRKAMALLQADGLVRVCQGRGSEVVEGKEKVPNKENRILYGVREMTEQFTVDGIKETSGSVVDVVQANPKIAEALKIPQLTDVYRIQRLKYCGDVPYDYVISYIPCELTPGLEQYSGRAFRLKRMMNEKYHITLTKATETFLAVAANFTMSNLLRIKVGDPLLSVCHVAYGEKGIVEYTESFLKTDIYRKGLVLDGGLGNALETDRMDEVLKREI